MWPSVETFAIGTLILKNDPNRSYVTFTYASSINNSAQLLVAGTDSRTGAYGYSPAIPRARRLLLFRKSNDYYYVTLQQHSQASRDLPTSSTTSSRP